MSHELRKRGTSMRRGAFALALFLIIADTAGAHAPVPGLDGFPGGLLHPVFVPAHLLALLGLGLFLGQQRARVLTALFFAAGLIGGLGAIASAVGETPANSVLLATAFITGMLTALALDVPRVVGWLLAVVTGAAIGLDSPPHVISVTEATIMLIGTGIGAAIVLIAVATAAAVLRREWQRIGVRVLASWTAASAILVLAMRFAK
jgi:urease accessory protein